MRLAWVELRDFRNHALTKLDPISDGLIVAVGPNGEGKTNLLEGMYFLYALASPRTSTTSGAPRGRRLGRLAIVATLAVTSSPTRPSPRVAAWTNLPCS